MIGVDKYDKASQSIGHNYGASVEITTGGCGSVRAWNELLARYPDYQRYVAGADDLIFYPDWLGISCAVQDQKRVGLVGFNDLNRDGEELATHWLATREFLVRFNGGVIYCPHYRSLWCDPELNAIAKREGQFAWAATAIVEHRHPNYGKAVMDGTYQISHHNEAHDREVFERRQAAGFPIDWPAIMR